MDLNAESMRLERLGVRGRWRRYWPTTTQQESPPACWPRGLGVGPPRVRGRKMRLGEVTQALRRREASGEVRRVAWSTVAAVSPDCLSGHRETFPRSGISV